MSYFSFKRLVPGAFNICCHRCNLHRLTVHARLQRGVAELAVALHGVAVPRAEVRALHVHGQVQRGAGAQALVVQVAAVRPGLDGPLDAQAGGSLRTGTRTELRRARMSYLQGECSTSYRHAEEEEDIHRRSIACSREPPCLSGGRRHAHLPEERARAGDVERDLAAPQCSGAS